MSNPRLQPVSLSTLGRVDLLSLGFLTRFYAVACLVSAPFELLVAKTPITVYLLRVGFGTLLIALFLYLWGKLAQKYIGSLIVRAWITGTLVFALGAGRSIAMNIVEAALFGTTIESNPFRPLLAGAGLYFAFACIALVDGIRKDYSAIKVRFEALSESIRVFKKQAEKRIQDEPQKLRRKAQAALLPLFAQLDQKLPDSQPAELIGELRNLITEKIRPLSQDFSKNAAVRIRSKAISIPKPRQFAAIPAKFRFNAALNPNLTALMVGPTLMIVAIYIFGLKSIAPFLVLLIASWLVGVLIVAVLPKRAVSSILVIGFSMAYSAFMWIFVLNLLSIWVTGQNAEPQVLVSVIAPAMAVSLTIMLVGFFADNVKTNLAQIQELQSQQKLYESFVNQKLWIVRRNWSYLIHGTVQSSVTLALTRLTGLKGKPSKKLLSELRNDIGIAIAALDRGVETEINLGASIRELVETWSGVCEVEVLLDKPVAALTKGASELNFGLNELLKELVSNGFRHGQASKVSIQLSQPEVRLIRIVAKNDGVPIPDDFKTNVGISMYNELCVSWNIKSPNPKKGATLTLELAL